MIEVSMPKFGLSMEKGFITKWYKKEGDAVKKGEPLVEVESEKITNDVPSPADGFLKKILVKEGEEQEVGKVIAYIAETEDELKEEIPTEEKPEVIEQVKEEEKVVVEKKETEKTNFIKASPIAKRLAKEYGIDLSTVKGSGPNGRIVEKDILNAIKGQRTETVETLSPMRKTIAENLLKSYSKSVLVTNMTEIDMHELIAFKQSLTEKVSITAILVKVAASILKKLPKFNATFDGNSIKRFSSVNIGVAVSTDKGLVVPVVKNADTLSLSEINREVKRLSDAARSGKLTADDVSDSHFTITNLGMMRTEMFTPVLNRDEVAILGVGRTVKKPVVVDDDKVAIRPMCWFSLSYNHIVIDGADAALLLGEFAKFIESKPFKI